MLRIYLGCIFGRPSNFIGRTVLVNKRFASQLSGQAKPPMEINEQEQNYTQGQVAENGKIREYFYFLDHQGQLFLDDTKIKNFTSCYKEQRFLEFFFGKLRANETDRYFKKFPFVSLCGLERNFLRCDDLPFVVTHLDEKNDMIRLNQIHSAHWTFHFEPQRLYHNLKTGRLYYLFENKEIIDNKQMCFQDPRRLKHLDKLPCKAALVKSDLSIRLMEKMHPVKKSSEENEIESFLFEYKSNTYELNNNSSSKASQIINKLSMYHREDSS